MKIDTEMLDVLERGRGMEVKTDSNGSAVAWKGPFLNDWFDNYTECLRENQRALRIDRLRREGKNEQGQTTEEEKAFKDRQRIQIERKKKAEAAILAGQTIEKGG